MSCFHQETGYHSKYLRTLCIQYKAWDLIDDEISSQVLPPGMVERTDLLKALAPWMKGLEAPFSCP